MLTKIITIENIGRFKNASATNDSQLKKHTTIVGANGYGKTTLCAILRSLQTGSPDHITGRKTVGAAKGPAVNLLLASGNSKFDGSKWTTTMPAMAIFDGVFIADNVHSGEVVDTEHKRNLYRVIIGSQGVSWAHDDARLAGESRTKTTDITNSTRSLQPHIPEGMKVEQFTALAADPDVDAKITEQERIVDAVRQAGQLKTRAALSEISLPSIPAGLENLLGRTLEGIATDAEHQIGRHLAAHGMEEEGATWIADGLPHAGETCPFCGQGVKDLPLVAAYRAVFSDGYDRLKSDLEDMRSSVASSFGEGAVGRLKTLAEQNRTAVEYWARYCTLDKAELDLSDAVAPALDAIGQAMIALLDQKIQRPLEALTLSDVFRSTTTATYADADKAVAITNEKVRAANSVIASRKLQADTTDLKKAEAELDRRKAIKARHKSEVDALCGSHAKHVADKEAIEKQKADIRTKLDAHTKRVVKPYEDLINQYLDDFNAGFRIAETKHSYAGGVATSSYQLVIEKHRIDLGDGRTPLQMPSFKNTLSAGDRTTLALAFFLANLSQDAQLKDKVVVFDDPFNSQDAFRRLHTIHEIMKVAGGCAQVIVLSHDATFLKQVWDKAPPADRTSLQICDVGALGSRIMPIDLAKACQGRTAEDLDDLVTYVDTGAGKRIDIIRKMRTVLETYCRTTYPGSFLNDDNLGDILGKIRSSGTAHPAAPLYDRLSQINDYTVQYHHGEDVTDATPDQIDPRELAGYARRTLKIANALQA